MRDKRTTIPTDLGELLGNYYVYALVDPSDGSIFYVGKGTAGRATSHLNEALTRSSGQGAKLRRIQQIRDRGQEPRIDIVRRCIPTEREAFEIEAALIDCLPDLTNVVKGQHVKFSRESLEELDKERAPRLTTKVSQPALLIRLRAPWVTMPSSIERGHRRTGHGWRAEPKMSDEELYDSVRAWWKVSPEAAARRGVAHAVAVHRGVTRAVYRIDGWLPPRRADGRRAFYGSLQTSGPVFEEYVGERGKRADFTEHSQNPITYWPR